MTKEEIYLKHVGKGTNVRSVYYQRCLDAMEEYAEQSRQAAVSGSVCVHPFEKVYQSETECYCELCGYDFTN